MWKSMRSSRRRAGGAGEVPPGDELEARKGRGSGDPADDDAGVLERLAEPLEQV